MNKTLVDDIHTIFFDKCKQKSSFPIGIKVVQVHKTSWKNNTCTYIYCNIMNIAWTQAWIYQNPKIDLPILYVRLLWQKFICGLEFN